MKWELVEVAKLPKVERIQGDGCSYLLSVDGVCYHTARGLSQAVQAIEGRAKPEDDVPVEVAKLWDKKARRQEKENRQKQELLERLANAPKNNVTIYMVCSRLSCLQSFIDEQEANEWLNENKDRFDDEEDENPDPSLYLVPFEPGSLALWGDNDATKITRNGCFGSFPVESSWFGLGKPAVSVA